MPRFLLASLLILALSAFTSTPTSLAAPPIQPNAEADPANALIGAEKGAWWGFEFIVCVATEVGKGQPISGAASICGGDLNAPDAERTPGQILQAWWGFEF